MNTSQSDTYSETQPDPAAALRKLLEQAQTQAGLLSDINASLELQNCNLDKLGQMVCLSANETHQNTRLLTSIRDSLNSLLEMYRAVHPEQALQLDKMARLQAELRKCCPPEEAQELLCKYEPCERHPGRGGGDGYSMKSRGFVQPVQVSEEPHESWEILPRLLNVEDDRLPIVRQGAFFGRIVPSAPTLGVMDFFSGDGGGSPPGSQAPVTFRTFSKSERSAGWPPDMSGAKGGDVVLMSGNLWLKLSVDGGKTFTDLSFTDIFAADKNYGGWAGDQVVHYIPSIDCFALYVQSFKANSGANLNKNVVKVALASPDDLKKFSGAKAAWWRQWDFTSDTFGLGAAWMDFPDLSYGDRFLHVNTNVFAGKTGKLFFELPLAELKAGKQFSFQYAFLDEPGLSIGSPIQNILADECYWAAHVDNSTLRIYSSRATETDYSWRDRKINNWPITTDNNIVSAAPDFPDWLSEDHRIIGATRLNNQLWFAWTGGPGDGGGGGFKFPHAHIQIAKFDLLGDYKLIEQSQVWNPDHAFAYPSLITNSDNEVGISLAWGGGKYFGSHAVGILGDFVVWFGEASTETSQRQKQDAAGNPLNNPDGTPVMDARFGDYLHVRLAQPDTRFFSAFGYSVLDDPAAVPAEKFNYLYVEFGRESLARPKLR